MENINKEVEYMKISMDIFSRIIEEIKNNTLDETDFFRILGVVSEYISDIKNLEYKKFSRLGPKWVGCDKKYPGSVQLNNEQ